MKKIFVFGLLASLAVMAGESKKKADYTDWIDCVSRLKQAPASVGKVFKTEPNRTVVLPGEGFVANKGKVKGYYVSSGKQCQFFTGIDVEELNLKSVKKLKGGDFCDAEKFEIQLGAETLVRLRNMNVIYEKSKLMLPASAKNDYVMSLQACFQYVPVSLKQDVADALAQFGEKPIESDGGIPLNAHPMADPNDSAVTK